MSDGRPVSKVVHAKRLAVGTAALAAFGLLGLILWAVQVILGSMPQWASAAVVLTALFAFVAYMLGCMVESFQEARAR